MTEPRNPVPTCPHGRLAVLVELDGGWSRATAPASCSLCDPGETLSTFRDGGPEEKQAPAVPTFPNREGVCGIEKAAEVLAIETLAARVDELGVCLERQAKLKAGRSEFEDLARRVGNLEADGGPRSWRLVETSIDTRPRLVVIESPFAGGGRRISYALAALRDSLDRGEAPIASHLLYPQVLDDNKPDDRKQGMEAGWAWLARAELVACYTDLGISKGMRDGIERAKAAGVEVEERRVPGWILDRVTRKPPGSI